jgi:exonuclease SbcD
MARLRQRFPHAVELRHQPPEVQRSSASQRSQTIRQARSPLELATSFFVDQQGRDATATEAELLRQALEQARRSGEQ